MASLSSRIKSSGFQKGFFGQLNTNIEKEADKQAKMEESVRGMKRNMDLYKSKAVYDTVQADITSRREYVRSMKTFGRTDAEGNFTHAGYLFMESQNNPSFEAYTPANQRLAALRLARSMGDTNLNTNATNLFGTDGGGNALNSMEASDSANARVTSGVNDMIGANAVTATEDAFTGILSPQPEVSLFPGEGIGAKDPLAHIPDRKELGKPKITIDPSGQEITQDRDKTGGLVGNPYVSKPSPEKIESRRDSIRVNRVDDETGAERGLTFDASRFPDGNMYVKTGTNDDPNNGWEPMGPRWTEADIQKSPLKASPTNTFELNDKEQLKFGARNTSLAVLADYTNFSTIGDAGIVRGLQIMGNNLGEWLTANHIGKGDPSLNLDELVSAYNDGQRAKNLPEMSEEREQALQELAFVNSESDDLAFNRGRLEAIEAVLPIMLAVNFSGTGRPAVSLVDSFKAGFGRNPGNVKAGMVAQLKKTLMGQNQEMFKTKYIEDATPPVYSDAGWNFTGELRFKKATGTWQYGIKKDHKFPLLWFNTMSLPSIKKLDLKHKTQTDARNRRK